MIVVGHRVWGDFDSWFRVASDRCYVRGVDCD